MKKKIGIMGGSFDPCHRGHINLAMDALEQGGLSELVLVPAKVQPFKADAKQADGIHRLNMLNEAVKNISGLRVSDWEMRQDNLSYTYLTMREAKKRAGEDAEVYFVTGTDAFLSIRTWKNAKELLSENKFIVGTRPGYKESELEKVIADISKNFGSEIIRIDNRRFHISSTEIRKRLEEGKDISDLVTEEVERYIKENGLYIRD